MKKLQPNKFQVMTVGSLVALALVTSPARASHDHSIIAPAIAFIALGSILYHNQHRHHYRHEHKRHHHHRPRHSASYGGYHKPERDHYGHGENHNRKRNRNGHGGNHKQKRNHYSRY